MAEECVFAFIYSFGAVMHHTEIWQDINTAVQRTIGEGLHLLDEGDLIERSDRLLINLPIVGGAQPTTALLLRRYQTPLQQELCQGGRPRLTSASVEDELREITRAVAATMGGDEGLSIESCALLALVLHQRSLDRFCATPAMSTAT